MCTDQGANRLRTCFFSELEKLVKKVQFGKENVVLVGDVNVALNRKTNGNLTEKSAEPLWVKAKCHQCHT